MRRTIIPGFSLSLIGCLLTAAFNYTSLVHQSAADPKTTLKRFEYKQYHMGVDVRIVAYAPDLQSAERGCTAAFERFAELDSIMSDYRPNSELMRLCDKAGGPPVPVSKDLFVVLWRAQEVSRLSDGAFDITCGPLVKLWREARKTHILPTTDEILRARRLVGWRKLRLNEHKHTAQLLVPGMKLDLGGIAKGYADDCAQEVLKKNGINNALVEAGGDIVVTGPPPDADGWRIQVANTGGSGIHSVMSFSNAAISSSGDTEQFVVIGGKRYSHIVDPRTGRALTNRVQVSLIAPNGLTSDPLTKTVSILGERARIEVLRAYPGAKAFIRVLPVD
jgi:thiamine biosynthesis lipoprotein